MEIKDYRALVGLIIEGAALRSAKCMSPIPNEPSRILNLLRFELISSEADKLTQAIIDESEARHKIKW